MYSLVKVLLFLGYAFLCKGRTIHVDDQTCENTEVNFDMTSGPIYLNYNSHNSISLGKEVCVYEFHKTDYNYQICIDLLDFTVESSLLKLEYHEAAYYRTTADETYDRYNRPVEKYCYDYSDLFVAFVSPYTDGYNRIRLKVYKVEDERYSRSSGLNTGLIIGLPLGIIAFIFLIACCAIIYKRKDMANQANSQRYVYHTANPNTVNYQAGGSGLQSTHPGGGRYQPAPIAQQGGFNVYPTQAAYLVGQEPAAGTHGTQPQQHGFHEGNNPPTGYQAGLGNSSSTGYRAGQGNFNYDPTVMVTSPQGGYMHQQDKTISDPPPAYPGY